MPTLIVNEKKKYSSGWNSDFFFLNDKINEISKSQYCVPLFCINTIDK